MDSKYLQPLIYEIVSSIEAKRLEEQHFPFVAIEIEIYTKISELARIALEELVKDNVLSCHPNINKLNMYSTVTDKSENISK